MTAALLHRFLTIFQHIKQNTFALLAVVWGFSITSCRDFEDCRTPYKSFVMVTFIPINKDDKLTINAINAATIKIWQFPENKIAYEVPLNPDTGSVWLSITGSSATPLTTLTIHYQKEPVLISHQRGCAYKYMLKKITSTLDGKHEIINRELSILNDSYIDVQIYL